MKEIREGMLMEKLPKVETFTCTKCSKEKTSKNVAHLVRDPAKKFCNGCYGEILVKNGK